MNDPTPAPVAANERIEFLDVLRGVALFGILVVNLPFLGMPMSEAMGGPSIWEGGGANAWASALIRALAQNKFMTLFSTLFGIGLALQVDRAAARGVEPSSFYPRRLMLLAVFGVLNGTMIFFGDILLPYAIAGSLLYLLRKKSPRTMLWIATASLVIGVTLSVIFEGLLGGGEGDGMGYDLRAAEVALAEGSFLEGSAARGMIYMGWLVLSSMTAFNWRIMALFLVGAVLLRGGLVTQDRAPLHRRVMILGLSIGLACESCSLLLHGRQDLDVALRVVDVLLHELGGLALSAGYAGAVATWCWSGGLSKLRRGIASTGRMALTNYLGQNIVAGLIFYGHGLGLYGEFSQPQIFVMCIVIYSAQVALSSAWMARVSGGPLELLWRWLTYPRR